uniref:interferon-stimulated 20 kDa exonuclease-like 2 n=1 Tax=Myxine glutinosa TaxID=7769 RepID=UPI00358FF107
MDIVLNVHYESGNEVGTHKKGHSNSKHEDFVRRKAMLERDFKLRQCKRQRWLSRTGVAERLAITLERAAVSLENKSASENGQPANHLAKSDMLYAEKKKNDVTDTPNLKVWQKNADLCASPISKHRYVGMDCEMVGTGHNGITSELARCSIVSYDGDVLYDCYVRPVHRIVDYRTRYSGITIHHMKTAVPFSQARETIVKILQEKVVVGHALHNDFDVIHLHHPSHLIRDTSTNLLLKKLAKFPIRITASLKYLTKVLLKQDIQMGKKGHSSVEDARAAMQLFHLVHEEWEKNLAEEVCVDNQCSSKMEQHVKDSCSQNNSCREKSTIRPQTKRVSAEKSVHVTGSSRTADLTKTTTTVKKDCAQSTSKTSVGCPPRRKKRKKASLHSESC